MSAQPGKSYVIFGGSGFIGSHLASALASSGADVVVADIVRPTTGIPGVRYEYCDVRRPIELEVFGPVTAAFNLAAVHRTPGHPDHEYYDTNVAGALNVTEWCERSGVTSICFTSSISVYGPTESLKCESSPLEPNSSYGRSKLLAERIHEDWRSRQDERRLITARPAVVFGPGERGNFTRLATALRQRRFVYPGRRDTIKSCGYVDDLVRAMLFALASQTGHYLFNYAYPERYTLEDICQAFQAVAGYAAPAELPPGLIRVGTGLAARVGAQSLTGRVSKLTASTNIEPKVLAESGFSWETDIKSALIRWFDAAPAGSFQ